MAADRGATTVTGVGSLRPARSRQELRIVWVFPRSASNALAPERLGGAGGGEIVIGRDETCAIRLEGTDVSRRHAAVQRSDGPDAALTLRDLGSRNGVRVNGRPVSSALIGDGDVVRLGGWVGVVTTASRDFAEIAPGLWGGGTLQDALAPLERAAPSDLPIILEGETGTGKEVVARTIHGWSGRGGPMVAVNCGALPEGLAEAELFGYRRGAFTGADRASAGFFRSAEGGTLLLDEVSDLPLGVQAKLLRVLEERTVQPLGETRPVPVDVRIVVAGQQPLMDAVREGRFRADLLARVDGVTVRLPPLRQRREDVLPLFSSLLTRLGQGQAPAVETDFAERLCLHDWPFNVRELVFLVRRLLTLHGRESTLRADHLSERIGVIIDPAEGGAEGGADAGTVVGASEALRQPPPPDRIGLPALLGALRASGGNVARAAAMLGITRQRAYRLMEGQPVDLEALRRPPESEAGSPPSGSPPSGSPPSESPASESPASRPASKDLPP